MDVINCVLTALVEYYPQISTVSLGYYTSSVNLTDFWKPVIPQELPLSTISSSTVPIDIDTCVVYLIF